jgi:hypothetical protein
LISSKQSSHRGFIHFGEIPQSGISLVELQCDSKVPRHAKLEWGADPTGVLVEFRVDVSFLLKDGPEHGGARVVEGDVHASFFDLVGSDLLGIGLAGPNVSVFGFGSSGLLPPSRIFAFGGGGLVLFRRSDFGFDDT